MASEMLIFVPTYNERENVALLFDRIAALDLDADILFIDDDSPDGTGDLLDAIARDRDRVYVLHRHGKLGIGSAHKAGIRWACDRGYRTLVTLDCDFTHPPEDIPRLIEASMNADVVTTSRFMRADGLSGWNIYRKCLTRLGHVLTRLLLGMPHDATGAFRLYRLDRIPRHLFDLVESDGYSFFFESLFALHRNGFEIAEIPIVLPSRTYGHSKMRFRDIWHSLRFLATIFLRVHLDATAYDACDPVVQSAGVPGDSAEWDAYWSGGRSAGGVLYDLVAVFYRKYIIRPSLNRHVRRMFPRGARLLHAGCGGGQVDLDIAGEYAITAFDISPKALTMYRRVHHGQGEIVHGSLFAMPFPDGSFDGIFNLGVMEHFPEGEITAVLAEMRRVLRPGGSLLLFWPPEYGLSVLFFKMLKMALRPFLDREPKFHPDEPCRLRSRTHAVELMRSAGFNVSGYAFSPADLFTYAVVVAGPAGDVAASIDSRSNL